MNIQKVKELVLSNKLAIENDSTVEKLNEVLKCIWPDDVEEIGTPWEYCFNRKDRIGFAEWIVSDFTDLRTIKVSEITFNTFKDKVIELRKQFPND